MLSAGADNHYEVIIAGAGQAGLAIGYFLAQAGRRFTILEATISQRLPGAGAGTR